ncbi:HdeD family acid-resistance protein [Microvirga yunnanensis]|uniref:HdeD family acid-resistance protein n=1 Tax=Microvirga yunnanensis TaxID=2953740 RepID=UPI0021C933C1|nr:MULTISPECIES: DUF308 domain-containing protein [unclassified Microvirga]
MATDLHAHAATPTVSPVWGWLLGVGLLALVLGGIGLYITIAFIAVGLAWYGLLLIVAGIVQTAEAIAVAAAADGWTSRLLRLLLGLLYIAAGLYAIFQPTGTGLALTLVLGILLVASGAVRAAWMLAREGRRSRGLGLILAVGSALLGLSMLAQWPLSGLWVIGLFVSADLIAYGLSWCWTAYAGGRP